MLRFILLCLPVLLFALPCYSQNTRTNSMQDHDTAGKTIVIRKTADFPISGDTTSANWRSTKWILLPQRSSAGQHYKTRIKLLYSATGLYFLYYCEDKKLTATMQSDFLDLWNEDVIEVFLQPDKHNAAYLEYELSPLNYELPIIIFNEKGRLNSWQPFHYDADRKTRHITTIQGGEKKPNAVAESWIAEFFIPYSLMKPVLQKNPVSGTTWKGNLYRIDYDAGEALWSWQINSGNFHEFEKFGNFQFE